MPSTQKLSLLDCTGNFKVYDIVYLWLCDIVYNMDIDKVWSCHSDGRLGACFDVIDNDRDSTCNRAYLTYNYQFDKHWYFLTASAADNLESM